MEGYYLLGGLIVGFILGALMYRNNAKKIEKDLNRAREEVDKLKNQLFKK